MEVSRVTSCPFVTSLWAFFKGQFKWKPSSSEMSLSSSSEGTSNSGKENQGTTRWGNSEVEKTSSPRSSLSLHDPSSKCSKTSSSSSFSCEEWLVNVARHSAMDGLRTISRNKSRREVLKIFFSMNSLNEIPPPPRVGSSKVCVFVFSCVILVQNWLRFAKTCLDWLKLTD